MSATSFIIGFISALAAGALALAGSYFYLKHRGRSRAAIKGYLDLIPDLSPEQRGKVQEIRRDFLPKVEGIRRNLRQNRSELASLLFAEPADKDLIFDKAREIAFHQSELEREVIEHILEERDLLTPAQKRRFYEIIIGQFSSGGLGVHDLKGH